VVAGDHGVRHRGRGARAGEHDRDGGRATKPL
jgi:hypothetical protein